MDISRVKILFQEKYTNNYGVEMVMVVDDRMNMYVKHEDNGDEFVSLKEFQNVIIQEEEQIALMEFIQKHICDD